MLESASITLTVSIVAYKQSGEVLRQTLFFLDQALAALADCEVRVYLVDNTEDARWQSVSEEFSKKVRPLIYMSLPENPGYAVGHNWFLLNSDAEFHLILNPDLYLEASALHHAVQHLKQDQQAALICPRVINEQGDDEYLLKRYPSVAVLALRGFAPDFLKARFAAALDHYEMRDVPRTEINDRDIQICSGCCMLLRTKLAQQIGGFDPQFFLYFEDFDFCLRLKQQGKLVYLPQMLATHLGGHASSKGLKHIYWFISSARRFFSKHGWKW